MSRICNRNLACAESWRKWWKFDRRVEKVHPRANFQTHCSRTMRGSEWEYESKSKIRTHSDYFLFFPHFNRLLEIGAHFFTSSDFHSNIFSISSESECVFFLSRLLVLLPSFVSEYNMKKPEQSSACTQMKSERQSRIEQRNATYIFRT